MVEAQANKSGSRIRAESQYQKLRCVGVLGESILCGSLQAKGHPPHTGVANTIIELPDVMDWLGGEEGEAPAGRPPRQPPREKYVSELSKAFI